MEETKGILESNPLSCAFFSDQNMAALQTNLRYAVWIKSNKQYVIAKQSEKELSIIMRSIYFQHSKNLPNYVLEQVKELNNLVLEYSIPKVIVQVKQYLEYQKHINGQRDILPHSINVSNRGSKQLSMKPWF
tara:strand:+ start:5918 stop:6313 length:396 start_codon:yes stop_codon:yes gene_type:complete